VPEEGHWGSKMSTLQFTPVSKQNWQDLETLFESKGGPHNCWCMVWRNMSEGQRANKADKKASLKAYVDNGFPVGLLCYENSVPVAWCSIAPRESYRELSGYNSLTNVWSLVCFFIRKEYRQKGIARELIEQAILYAKNNGAKYVEAYPVDPESPSYRFMGFKPIFDNLGFDFKHMAGQRRYVMTIAV